MSHFTPIKALLFDLDGVLINTEPQYDIFWRTTAEKYQLGVDRFESLIKGTTLPHIISRYFSHLPEKTQATIIAANRAFDLQLDILPIPGAPEFLTELKHTGFKTGLVTSSDDAKLERIFRTFPSRDYFDAVVSANRITAGKPDPMCYLLAAQDLGLPPSQCVVFEDSIAGITAAVRASMKVIGLTTTLPTEQLKQYTPFLLPDFTDKQQVFTLLQTVQR